MKSLHSLPVLLIAPSGALAAAAPATQEQEALSVKKVSAQNRPGQKNLQADELHDIQGPVPLPVHPPYWEIGGAALLVLAVLAGVFLYLKKRRRPAPAAPPTPWETALAELAAAKKLQGQGLLYMERASEILRRYIESRFAIRSTRQTTREFLAGLGTAGENSPLAPFQTELQACLERADMAKFARLPPEPHHTAQMEQAVTNFVRKTEPAVGGAP